MTYVLGVDGGTTKTVALIAGDEGAILGAGHAGGANIYAERPVDRALDAVTRAVDMAMHNAGVHPDLLDVALCSMAGADCPEDIRFLQEALQRRSIGRVVLVVNDALGALQAGSPDGTGIVVACGTGAAVGARTAAGRVWYSGFWQLTGGSHDLARKALHAVYQATLGLAPPTALTGRVLALFTTRQVDLVQRQVPLVLTGGVLRHPSPVLREALVTRAQARLGDVRPLMSRFEPAVGALFLALEAAGIRVDTPRVERLASTLPHPAVFDT